MEDEVIVNGAPGDYGSNNSSGSGPGSRRRLDPAEKTSTSEEGAEVRAEWTVEDAVEHIGFGWFQIRFVLICGLLTATDAMEMMLLAVLSPVLRCEWYLQDWQVALVSTIIFIGMFIGSTLWGRFADKYGRYSITLLCSLLLIWYGILTAFSPNIYWVMTCRCLVGWAFGGVLQGFVLLSEYVPSKQRAKMLVVTGASWSVGSLIEVSFAWLVLPRLGWRYLVGLSVLPLAVAVLCLYFLPESARFLVAAGRRDEAQRQLQRAADVNGTRLPPWTLVQQKKDTGRGDFKDLFHADYRRTTSIMWFMWFGAAFMAYGVVLLNSELLEQGKFCGLGYATMVNSAAGKLELDDGEQCHCELHQTTDYVSMVVSTCGEFLVVPINMLAVDTLGRRRTILLNYTMAGLLFLFLNICSSLAGYTVLIFAIRAFSSAIFNICYIYTAEVFPTSIRSLAIGTCSSCARLGSMVTPFVAQVLIRAAPTVALNLYAVFAVTCGLISLGLTIETKGRELRQGIAIDKGNR